MSQDEFIFHAHRNLVLPYYPKEHVLFPYLRHYHSIPSLINHPDADYYQDNLSQSPPITLKPLWNL